MKHIGRDIVYNSISRINIPSLTVRSGERFSVMTELCSGTWLRKKGDVYKPSGKVYTNPTVCVKIEDAVPGDAIRVNILSIEPENIGYTGVFKKNPLFDKFFEKEQPEIIKIVEIQDNVIKFSDSIEFPVSPMIGVLATAPAEGILSSECASHCGGNMDIQEVCVGTSVYLPVEVPGALLHIGDTHAIQGDGEIACGGGIECRSKVIMQVECIKKPKGMKWVRMENANTIMTAAFCPDTDESFYEAVNEMLCWLENEYSFERTEAFMLLAQQMKARNTQMVNPTRSYICKIDKKYLIT